MFYLAEENFTAGTVAISVKYGVVPYFVYTYDLCKVGVIHCPVKAGNGTAVFKYTVAEYQSIVSIFRFTCVNFFSSRTSY